MSTNEGPVIDVSGMTKRFGDRTVVNSIGLRVEKGQVYGFLGPNGSGKTTFIRMLCGLLKPDGGSGTCMGHDVITESQAIKRQVGYMTQKFSYYEDLSIAENLDFVARLYQLPDRKAVVSRSIEELGLGGRENQLAGELSGGWKQRMALAACLLHKPKLLLLDEPTAGVDPKARRDFWEQIHALAARGLTFLITTHYMDEAESCDRLAYISYGNLLVDGTVQDVIEHVHLTTWQVAGPDLQELAEKLRGKPGVEQAVSFGRTLHVSGSDSEALKATISPFMTEPYKWQIVESDLEDAFIHLMDSSQDNYSRKKSG
jgi:ABC-2 type transport system ATP-binding protein